MNPDESKQGAPWTLEEEARLRELHGAGQDPLAIAEALGRAPKSVTSRLMKLKLVEKAPKVVVPGSERKGPPRSGLKWLEKEDMALLEGWHGGYTIPDMAKELERDPREIRERLKELGWETE
jgi:hypothetical protein